MKRPILLVCAAVLLTGCVTPVTEAKRDAVWRQTVRSYLHDDEARLSGPIRGPAWPAETHFTPSDEQALRQLLEAGAVGYLVFVPDYKPVIHASDGSLVEMIRVARVVVIANGKVAGDYETR